MKNEDKSRKGDGCIEEGMQSALAWHYIEDYLQAKGYSWKDLKELPEAVASKLRQEACTYASLKLAEVESRARFTQKISGKD